jgi:hypothetical protein
MTRCNAFAMNFSCTPSQKENAFFFVFKHELYVENEVTL